LVENKNLKYLKEIIPSTSLTPLSFYIWSSERVDCIFYDESRHAVLYNNFFIIGAKQFATRAVYQHLQQLFAAPLFCPFDDDGERSLGQKQRRRLLPVRNPVCENTLSNSQSTSQSQWRFILAQHAIKAGGWTGGWAERRPSGGERLSHFVMYVEAARWANAQHPARSVQGAHTQSRSMSSDISSIPLAHFYVHTLTLWLSA
jgi:hypothetical protein